MQNLFGEMQKYRTNNGHHVPRGQSCEMILYSEKDPSCYQCNLDQRRVSQINYGGVGFRRGGDLSNSGLLVQFWRCAYCVFVTGPVIGFRMSPWLQILEVPTTPEFLTETCSIIFWRSAALQNGFIWEQKVYF